MVSKGSCVRCATNLRNVSSAEVPGYGRNDWQRLLSKFAELADSIMDAHLRHGFAGVLKKFVPVLQIKWPIKAICKKSFGLNRRAKGKCCSRRGEQPSE